MFETLPPVGILAPSALAGLSVLLILTGRLVPRKTLEDIEHDRDEWRTAHRISETARQEERDHNAALIRDVAEPIKGFLQGFRKEAAAARSEVDDK
jgi:hypothetical protein